MLSIIVLAIAGLVPFDIVKVVAFGLLIYLWNRLGLSDRLTLIGNIVAALVLIVFVFLL